MKYGYVDGWNQSANIGRNYYINKMLALESQYPGKVFIWTTSILWHDPGGACGEMFNSCQQIAEFNQQIRAYARAHNKPLYDMADIESHDHNGNPCTIAGYEGLCTEWNEGGGGHPNIEGSIRLAKGFWWLIANLGAAPSRTSVASPTPRSTATPTPSRTPIPTNIPSRTRTPASTNLLTPGAEAVNPANISTLPAGTNVLLNFNNFPSNVDGKPVPAQYAGGTWNTLAEGAPWAGIATWNIFVTNGGVQGTITFPRPVIIKSLVVSSAGSNVFTLRSPGNADVSITTANNAPRTLTTNWTNPVTSLTLRSSTSDQAFDDLRLTTR
jgi:hypothetical protein